MAPCPSADTSPEDWMDKIGASTTGTLRKSSVNLGREYNFLIEGGGCLDTAGFSHSALSCSSKNMEKGNTFYCDVHFGK